MTEFELNVIDWAYRSMVAVDELVENDVPKLDTNILINYVAFFISLIAAFVAILSLCFTIESYRENIQKNKEIIIKDRMIGAMSNVVSNMRKGGDYRGTGMFMVYPIDEKKKFDMGIISKWNQVPTQPDIPNGNHNFVFTYRIFYGNQDVADHILKSNDWSNTNESVSIHLIRTGDGHYTLADRRILNSISDFNPGSTTVFLDKQDYNCIIMMLDFIMMCNHDQLMECQDRIRNVSKDDEQ